MNKSIYRSVLIGVSFAMCTACGNTSSTSHSDDVFVALKCRYKVTGHSFDYVTEFFTFSAKRQKIYPGTYKGTPDEDKEWHYPPEDAKISNSEIRRIGQVIGGVINTQVIDRQTGYVSNVVTLVKGAKELDSVFNNRVEQMEPRDKSWAIGECYLMDHKAL